MVLQEQKKLQVQGQGQTMVGQENFYVPRPSTSNRRLSVSDRSINGDSSVNATPLNRRLSLLGSKTINSPPHENIPSIKEAKKERRRLKAYPPFNGDDAASVVSSFSAPFSP